MAGDSRSRCWHQDAWQVQSFKEPGLECQDKHNCIWCAWTAECIVALVLGHGHLERCQCWVMAERLYVILCSHTCTRSNFVCSLLRTLAKGQGSKVTVDWRASVSPSWDGVHCQVFYTSRAVLEGKVEAHRPSITPRTWCLGGKTKCNVVFNGYAGRVRVYHFAHKQPTSRVCSSYTSVCKWITLVSFRCEN